VEHSAKGPGQTMGFAQTQDTVISLKVEL
jgi:hypothetical protein